MMNHEYRDLVEHIHVSEALNDRVVQAARQKNKEKAVPKRRNWRPAFRAAACTALALVLVLGGVSLRMRTDEGAGVMHYNEALPIPELYFEPGITAYAAQPGANGGAFLHELAEETAAELNGTVQTLSLTFADGSVETGVYRLQTEELRRVVNEDGTEALVPALSGETGETVSGLYAEPEDRVWFRWPVEGANTVSLSNAYGYRWNPGGETRTFHAGIDIPAEQGSPVTAAAGGTVTKAEFDPDKGNYVVIDHGNGMGTVYAQCLRLTVAVGDTVEAGEKIAEVGSTGKSTGPHLCFQVWQEGEAQNPVAYFDSDIRNTLRMG